MNSLTLMVSQQMKGMISYNNHHHVNLAYEEFHALFYQSPNLLQHFHTSFLEHPHYFNLPFVCTYNIHNLFFHSNLINVYVSLKTCNKPKKHYWPHIHLDTSNFKTKRIDAYHLQWNKTRHFTSDMASH